jgi:hypothetical protein
MTAMIETTIAAAQRGRRPERLSLLSWPSFMSTKSKVETLGRAKRAARSRLVLFGVLK